MSLTEEPKAAHVIEALCRVMRDLPSIEKGGTAAPQQGGYRYRGIDQITPHTQELFARHCVLFAPRVVSFELRELMVGGKPWTDVVEEVEYDVYGPGGVEDKIVIGPILAIGRDNSDKGGNKCLTQAMKYALLQAFQVSDPKDDADGTTHEADVRRPEPAPAPATPEQLAEIKRLDAAIPAGELWDRVVKWSKDQKLPAPGKLTADQAQGAIDFMTPLAVEAAAGGDGAEPTTAGSAPDPDAPGAYTQMQAEAEAVAARAAGEGET